MYIPESEYKLILRNMPVLCVDLLIIYEGKCLLLKRDNEPAMGQYWFPGGRINKLETIKDAAIRKAKEETNLDCEFIKIVAVEETIFVKNENMNTDVHTVNICCQLIPVTITPLQIDMYHKDYKWVNQQSNSYHKAVNHPLALIGFISIEPLNQNAQL
jgi:colanic acid biosynthesis protein WcaH